MIFTIITAKVKIRLFDATNEHE